MLSRCMTRCILKLRSCIVNWWKMQLKVRVSIAVTHSGDRSDTSVCVLLPVRLLSITTPPLAWYYCVPLLTNLPLCSLKYLRGEPDRKQPPNCPDHSWLHVTDTVTTHWKATPASDKSSEDGTWWYRPVSADVETTAYALLATLEMSDEDNKVENGLNIVRWLSQQRNAYGGFGSTQVWLRPYYPRRPHDRYLLWNMCICLTFYCEASYVDDVPWCEHLFSIDIRSACDGNMVCI